MKQRARLFAIAEYLRGRRTGVTASELAERFGVTIRTIYRDLDALRDGSLPVIADRGRGGGYALDRSYSLPPVNFTAREAALLLAAARWASELRLIPFTDTLASGIDKVRSALSSPAQRELNQLMQRFRFVGVPTLPAPAGVRKVVEQAWFERRLLAVRYRHASGEVAELTVRIDAVLSERTFTLLECEEPTDPPREGLRLRLDRIERAHLV